MNFPGYNPSMFNNMNMDQMKMASDMLSGMSDEQLRGYAKMMGTLLKISFNLTDFRYAKHGSFNVEK